MLIIEPAYRPMKIAAPPPARRAGRELQMIRSRATARACGARGLAVAPADSWSKSSALRLRSGMSFPPRGVAPSAAGVHASAAHTSRAAPSPAAAGACEYDGLREVVSSLSFPVPGEHAAAVAALHALAETRDRLVIVAPTLADPDLREGLGHLVTIAGWVLEAWTGKLAAIEPAGWQEAHAAELRRDLVQIVQAGARILDRIEKVEVAPATGGFVESYAAFDPMPDTARHRRRQARPARPEAGRPQPGRVEAADLHGGVLVLGAAGFTALILAVGWYLAYDTHPSRPVPGRPATPSASTPTSSARAGRLAPPSAGNLRSTSPTGVSPAPVASIQILPLGSSAHVQRVDVELLIDAVDTEGFVLRISWGRSSAAWSGTETRELVGGTTYDFVMPIQVTKALCSGPVVIEASAGTVTTTTSTLAGPCPATSSVQPGAAVSSS